MPGQCQSENTMAKNANRIAANDAEIIANAVSFNVYLRKGREKISEDFPTQEAAKERANALRAENPGRDVLISVVDAKGQRCPVNGAAKKIDKAIRETAAKAVAKI